HAASAHHCKPTSSWFCTLWGANCSCLPAIMLDSCSESLQGFVQQSRAEVEVNVPEKKLVFSEHTITYASWSIPARVLWRNGNYFGLEFKGLMGVDHLDQLVATS
ncbi:hypothetical protein, partial [Pseudophaeobacter sp.]|uniref:hypothetical protein n=1 Tax=Pseudophaeobacter sp. TaxID=1971739 RepID=UPI0040592EEB